jgi:hypothetical protein
VNTGTPETPDSVALAGKVSRQDEERGEISRSAPPLPREVSVEDVTIATTTLLRRSLKLQAQTAVLQTQSEAEGYRSFAQRVNGALERELQRLSDEYNGGVPFRENPGRFRTGRPFSN